MAASKRARNNQREKPGDSTGVPVEGSKPTRSARVARGRKGAGAVPQADGDGATPVPGLSDGERSEPLSNNRKHPTNDPNVWQAAVTRASYEGYWRKAEWNVRIQAWTIPSETDPAVAYVISRDHVVQRHGTYWWERFKCSCAAGQRGFRVCKHKAAVWLKRVDLETDSKGPFAPK
jgi:hypothetical protein